MITRSSDVQLVWLSDDGRKHVVITTHARAGYHELLTCWINSSGRPMFRTYAQFPMAVSRHLLLRLGFKRLYVCE